MAGLEVSLVVVMLARGEWIGFAALAKREVASCNNAIALPVLPRRQRLSTVAAKFFDLVHLVSSFNRIRCIVSAILERTGHRDTHRFEILE